MEATAHVISCRGGDFNYVYVHQEYSNDSPESLVLTYEHSANVPLVIWLNSKKLFIDAGLIGKIDKKLQSLHGITIHYHSTVKEDWGPSDREFYNKTYCTDVIEKLIGPKAQCE